MATLALTAALIAPLGFHPHTHTELADWQAGWSQRMVEGETPQLIAEWLDMDARHPSQLVECPQPKEVRHRDHPGPYVAAPPAGVEQWRSLVAAYFPPEEVDRALRIMACESGGNPNAYNPSGASGLMQVLASWADNFGLTPDQLFDPATNLQVARWLWDDGGWGHWVCRG